MTKLSAMIVSILLLWPVHVKAFWLNTHEKITYQAIETQHNNLNSKIKEQTGLDNALDTYIAVSSSNRMLKEWLANGSVKEDDFPNYLNHFYNPLAENNPGLNDPAIPQRGISSYEWASRDINTWSWKVARDKYRYGLISNTDTARRTALAESFRAIGQVMHLVQDLASPAHVRNDGHMWPDGFEAYVDENVNPLNFSASSLSIPTTAVSTSAPKQFWDSETYTGSNPSASTSIGLAEYTNANFASGDTIFSENNLNDLNPLNDAHYFPHPAKADTEYFEEYLNRNWMGFDVYRKYHRKIRSGEQINHFAYAGRLYRYLGGWPEYQTYTLGLDNQCYSNYSDKLLPRAVGYSAGLLNYFFRGKISMEKDPQNAGKYIIKNESGEKMDGTFALYYDDASGNRNAVPGASWTLAINPNSTSSPVTFTEPTSPAPKEKGKYILVFEGRLGMEEGAVGGREVKFSCDGNIWEDWECGATGRHQWRINGYGNLPPTVIDGYDSNKTKVLSVFNGYSWVTLSTLNFDDPIDVPRKVSFDYYATSMAEAGYFTISLKTMVGYGSCSIIMNNYSLNYCDNGAICWIPIQTGKWTHVEVTEDMLKCSKWTQKILNVRIGAWWGEYNPPVVPQLYLDNINFGY